MARKFTTEETARRGREFYERQIRPQIPPADFGKIIAIDVETGDYALAETVLAAVESLRKKRPEAESWCVRAGDNVLYRIGSTAKVSP